MKPLIKWDVLIAMAPDLDFALIDEQETAPCEPFGVFLSITRHNQTTGVMTKYSTAGIWGLDCDTDMSYVLELAQEEFETLKAEYPGTFDLIVIDAATPARFV